MAYGIAFQAITGALFTVAPLVGSVWVGAGDTFWKAKALHAGCVVVAFWAQLYVSGLSLAS